MFFRRIILFFFILSVGELKAQDTSTVDDLRSLLLKVESIQNSDEQIDINLKIALNYYYLGKLKESLYYARQAQNSIKHYTDPLIIAQVHLYLGNFLLELAKYTYALDHFQISYNIYSELQFVSGQSKTLSNMGIVFERLNHPEIALEYQRRVLDLNNQLEDSSEVALAYTNMGNIYLELEKYELAYSYYRDAADLDSINNDQYSLSVDFNNLGILFQKINEPDIAFLYFQKSYNIEKETGNILSMAGSLENIARVYEQKNKLELAYESAILSLEYARQSGSLTQEKNTSSLLSSIEEKRGNSKEAFDWYKNYMSISDVIDDEQKSYNNISTNHLIETTTSSDSEDSHVIQDQIKNILIVLVIIIIFGIIVWLLSHLIKAV